MASTCHSFETANACFCDEGLLHTAILLQHSLTARASNFVLAFFDACTLGLQLVPVVYIFENSEAAGACFHDEALPDTIRILRILRPLRPLWWCWCWPWS